MFNAGVEDTHSIAAELGIPRPAVIAILMRAGIPKEKILGVPLRKDMPEDAVREIVLAYGQWIPDKDICRQFGISKKRLYTILNNAGVPLRRYQAEDELARLRADAELVQLYKDGMPVMDICRLLGISNETLNSTLRKYNTPLRQPKETGYARGEEVDPTELLAQLTSR